MKDFGNWMSEETERLAEICPEGKEEQPEDVANSCITSQDDYLTDNFNSIDWGI